MTSWVLTLEVVIRMETNNKITANKTPIMVTNRTIMPTSMTCTSKPMITNSNKEGLVALEASPTKVVSLIKVDPTTINLGKTTITFHL